MCRDVLRARFAAALLAAAALGGGASITIVDPTDTRWLGCALVGFVAVAAVARPVRWAWIGAAGLAAAAYGAGQAGRALSGAGVGLQMGVALVVFGVVALVGHQLDALLDGIERTLERSREAIDELSPLDETTGAYRRRHAEKVLHEEVERARRYDRPLSLVILGPAVDPPRLAELLLTMVRTVDTVGYDGAGRFWVIVPETPLAGAEVLSDKVRDAAEAELETRLRAGVASFPADAVTAPELVREAEAAYGFALREQLPVASRRLFE